MARYFGVPFATTGDKIVIPDAVQPDGSVSFSTGFGFDYQRPNTDPSYKPVPRDGMNGLFHDITEAIGDIQKQGVADWTSDAAPYPINAMVRYSDKVWRSLIGNNSSTPSEGLSWTESPVFTYDMVWRCKAIGEPFFLWDQISGVDAPPIDNPNFRFIKLTAADAYNAGVLTSETVSGTAPNLSATAVINLTDSPMNGMTVHLINTERRFIRPGNSGALEDSENKLHGHPFRANYAAQSSAATNTTGGFPVVLGGASTQMANTGSAGDAAGSQIGGSGGNESRPRNIGANAYMRIK